MSNDNETPGVEKLLRLAIRFSPAEAEMLAELTGGWQAGETVNVATVRDALRRCILEAYNKRQRSIGLPEVPAVAGDILGEVRTGRPKKGGTPYYAGQMQVIMASREARKQKARK